MTKRKNNTLQLPIVKEIPQHLKTYMTLQADGTLPLLPTASIQEIKAQAKLALFRFISTPGLVLEPLTKEEKSLLAPIEVWAYNKAMEIQQDDCDFNVGRYIADLVIGPPVQKTESVRVTGDIRDWESRLDIVVEEMSPKLDEAKRIEKERYERANT